VSTDWHYYCETCDEDGWGYGADLNHQGDALKDLLVHFPLLARLAAAGLDVDPESLNVSGAYRVHGLAQWVLKHEGHVIRVKSEYGDIDGECSKRIKCTGCGGNRQRCGLPEGHDGDCVPK
jgi:hypothetical protein